MLLHLVLLTSFFASFGQKTSKELTAETVPFSEKTMYVKGRSLYTAEDEKIVLRGVNEMFIWSNDHTGENILPEISKTGANSIRLVWTTLGEPAELEQLIGNSLKNGMIPMVELHDATGDWSKLPIVLDYWVREDVKDVMNKYKEWVLLNIANEAGSDNNDSTFITNYKNAITHLREAGYTIPLIIDAPDWGKDEQVIIRSWKEVFDHDPLKNIMFSVHTYWVEPAGKAEARLEQFLSSVVQDTIPLLFGEGPQPNGWDCKTAFPYQLCIQKCEEHGIGWLSWSWGAQPNGDCGEGEKSNFDITTDGIYGNWNNDWGRLISTDDEFSIQKTSLRPVSLMKMMQ